MIDQTTMQSSREGETNVTVSLTVTALAEQARQALERMQTEPSETLYQEMQLLLGALPSEEQELKDALSAMLRAGQPRPA